MKTKKKGIKKNKRMKGGAEAGAESGAGATKQGKLEQRLTSASLPRTARLPRASPETFGAFPPSQNNPKLRLYTQLNELLNKMKNTPLTPLTPEEKQIIDKSIEILNQRITTSRESSTNI